MCLRTHKHAHTCTHAHFYPGNLILCFFPLTFYLAWVGVEEEEEMPPANDAFPCIAYEYESSFHWD